jgi:hypothetical protein
MGFKNQPKAMRTQKRNLKKKSIDQKFYTELKKVYFMAFEIQP